MDDKDKPAVLLQYYLKKLKLSTMLKEYALVAQAKKTLIMPPFFCAWRKKRC